MILERLYKWGRHLPGPPRALLRLLASRCFERGGYPLAGPLSVCRMCSATPLGAYLEGIYEPGATQMITRMVQPRCVCVDVGAHIGYLTLLLAKLVAEDGRAIALDAHPEDAEKVRSNVGINSYGPRVQVENMAVSDATCHRVKFSP